jgi:Fe2+ transport system protein FeoA
LELKQGDVAVINRISGGRGILARMSGLGLYEGKKIRVVQAAPFRGPLLVEDVSSGARVMIGRGVASHVEIRDERG